MTNAVPEYGTPRGASAGDAGGTIEKAIDLLFFLHASGGARGVSDIGRALGLPKSSAHRLLAALGRRGLVEQDEHGRYRPGIALLALGLGALEREPLAAAAHPVLERESEATGETAFLTVARRGRIVVLDKREGVAFLRVAPTIGSEVPVHATAVGKLHLAFAPESVELPAEPWPVFTGQTPIARDDLEREVARAKKRGWATNRDEWIPGMTVVAAPVLLRGRMLGCMVIAAPSSRVAGVELAALATRVVRAAADIAERLEPEPARSRPAAVRDGARPDSVRRQEARPDSVLRQEARPDDAGSEAPRPDPVHPDETETAARPKRRGSRSNETGPAERTARAALRKKRP